MSAPAWQLGDLVWPQTIDLEVEPTEDVDALRRALGFGAERPLLVAGSTHEGEETLNLTELLPDLFERYFEFFRRGHHEGVLPARIKELARLKVAALNECDT